MLRSYALTASFLVSFSQFLTPAYAGDFVAQASPQPVQMDLPGSSDIAPPQPVPMNLPVGEAEYQQLRQLLADRNWVAADEETRRLMYQWVHPSGDMYGTGLASSVPVDVIQTIDRLWSQASNGRYGFSAQLQVWQEVNAQTYSDRNAMIREFGDRLGWIRTTPLTEGHPGTWLASDWITEQELNNSLENNPTGYFPWPGVSWDYISNILTTPGCGSCTIDAMYLQGERFNAYIGLLYPRVEIALSETPPSDSAIDDWINVRVQHQINLSGLYPDNSNSCPIYTVDQEVSPNSQIVAVSSYNYERTCGGAENNSTLALWNAERGVRLITLLRGQARESFSYAGTPQEPPTEQTRMVGEVANAIAFTPDSQWIAAGLSNGAVRVWNTQTGEIRYTLSGHTYAVRAIAISPDGQTLVSASSDHTMKVWDLVSGTLSHTFQLNEAKGIVHTIAFSPDGQRVATATDYNTLELWNLATRQWVRTLVQGENPEGYWLPMSFSSNGEYLATGDRDYSVKLWNAYNGARIITLQGHQQPILSVAFNPTSNLLASSSLDNTARLWVIPTYRPLYTLTTAMSTTHPAPFLPNPGGLSFSPDGRLLLTGALLLSRENSEPLLGPGAFVWDVENGRQVIDVQGVTGATFSPNGEFIFTRGFMPQIWRP